MALGVSLSAVGDLGVAYSFDASCGVIPDSLDVFDAVFPGGTVTGHLCWAIADADADGLLLIVDGDSDGERVFLAVR